MERAREQPGLSQEQLSCALSAADRTVPRARTIGRITKEGRELGARCSVVRPLWTTTSLPPRKKKGVSSPLYAFGGRSAGSNAWPFTREPRVRVPSLPPVFAEIRFTDSLSPGISQSKLKDCATSEHANPCALVPSKKGDTSDTNFLRNAVRW